MTGGPSTGALRFLLISCITLYFIESVNCNAVVKVNGTHIIGQSVYSGGSPVNQFLAIPYAEPPLGKLRFKPPTPRKYLPDLYYALNEPPACLQYSEYPWPWYDSSNYKSEDCLYLNIWAPRDASPSNKKAVIYFIPGGGFRFGSIKLPVFNAAPLAAFGDVIVVTVNFRLNTFGFLTSNTEDAPGNVGLYDMLEGLKWVNKHIEAFGGDTSRITLAGSGAGATGASILTTSPMAKGLFQRIIMESGSFGYPDNKTVELNLFVSQKVAEKVFCANESYTINDNPKEVVECLRNVPALTLSGATSTIQPLTSVLYIPQFGGDLIPMDYQKSLQADNFSCNNLLIGSTHEDGSYQLSTHHPDLYGFFGEKNPVINKTLGKQEMNETLFLFPDTEKIINHYLSDSIPDNFSDTVRKQVYTAFGDFSIVCPQTFYAEQCAAKGNDVYYYVFNHRPRNTPWAEWMGVAHGSELEFVFGNPLLYPTYHPADEVQLSKTIIDIWSTFAKTGKPSIPWTEYSKKNPNVKVLGPGATQIKDKKGYHQDNCNFIRPIFGFQ